MPVVHEWKLVGYTIKINISPQNQPKGLLFEYLICSIYKHYLVRRYYYVLLIKKPESSASIPKQIVIATAAVKVV